MKNCFTSANILLPSFALEAERMTKWACIACDQYTSEPEYWNETEATVGDAPSTLRLILPELYLDEAEARIPVINATMRDYASGLLVEHKNSMIFLERTLRNGKIRRGLVGAVDLDCYEYTKGATSLVRATEGTVLERIPPRVKIREGAPVELPHVMILIDDAKRTVIEPLVGKSLECAYDFDLMQGGGHVKGGFLPESEQTRVTEALDALCVGENPLLFAVGDGNHSLASAKAYWEQLKPTLTESELASHPARYALAEIVNIHDEALDFEPIYRVVFGVEPEELMSELKKYAASLPKSDVAAQEIECICGEKSEVVTFENPTSFLHVGTLQSFIDGYLKSHESAKVDYIHGEDSARKLSGETSVAFLFPGMGKGDLFPTVVADGALPRKTFSMGEAYDKRYYLEARAIR